MRKYPHYANSARMSFAEVLTSSGTAPKHTKLQIHLAITSDRLVTDTSNLDHRCEITKHGECTSQVHLALVAPASSKIGNSWS